MFQFRFDDGRNPLLGPYNKPLKCFPVVMMNSSKERSDVDRGGKIILPSSALDHLTRLRIEFPMLFHLTNKNKNRDTHCGVLEFIAEEGRCYLPYWMMRNLLLTEGDFVQVEYVNLPIAKFAKFQPQSVDFLEISNPKAVLENALRTFATLSKGDVISINYNEKDYELSVLETRPGNAVSIIECDMDVDFAEPIGYQEPEKVYKSKTIIPATTSSKVVMPTANRPRTISEGYRLDGKCPKASTSAQVESCEPATNLAGLDNDAPTRGIPYYDYPVGSLRLNRFIEKAADVAPEKEERPNTGQKLKHIGMTQ